MEADKNTSVLNGPSWSILGEHAHPRRLRKAKGLGDREQVEGVHIEDLLQLVGVVGKEVGAVGVARAGVQVEILLHQLLKLALHVGQLALWELVLVQWHLGFLHNMPSKV